MIWNVVIPDGGSVPCLTDEAAASLLASAYGGGSFEFSHLQGVHKKERRRARMARKKLRGWP